MVTLDLSGIELKLRQENDKTSVFDIIRKLWVVLTPEEHVRQYIIHYLAEVMHYPTGLMAVEKTITVGAMKKRFDIVVYDREHQPWLLVECKAPEVLITDKTLQQLLNYQRTIQCDHWMLTNGHQNFCADASNINDIRWVDVLPVYEI